MKGKEEKMNMNEGKQKELDRCTESREQDAPKKKIRAGAVISSIGWGALYSLWGYVMGNATLPFGAMPFGIAFLCAADRRVPYVYAGLCLAAWGGGSRILLISTYTAILLVRLLVRFLLDAPWSREEGEAMGERTLGQILPLLFSEQIALRMSTAALAAFGVGLYRLMVGGYLYYDLYGTILMTVTAPVTVLLFTGFWGRAKIGSDRYLSGLLAIAFVLIWEAGDAKLYTVSLGAFGGMLLTLYLTRKQGLIVGVIAGTVCGLAVSVSLSPAFAFAALAAGLLFPVSVFFAVISASSVAIAWGTYVQGIDILNGIASAFLAAPLLFVVLDKLFFAASARDVVEEGESDAKKEKSRCRPFSALEREGLLRWEANLKIQNGSESLSTLSASLREISQRMRMPSATELRRICDRAFESACVSCADRSRCWSERYHETTREIGKICGALYKSGRVERAHVTDALASGCGRLPDILEEINHNASLYRKELCEGDRTEIFATEYQAMAEIFQEIVSDRAEEDRELSARLCETLNEVCSNLTGVCALGGIRRCIAVRGADRETLLASEEEIRTVIESVCPFSIRAGVLPESGEAMLIFRERERFSAFFAGQSLRAEGEETYCGDTVNTFRSSEGGLYALISDGMGAGKEAALTSETCGVFLQRLLGVGYSCDTALRMLNAYLRNRGSGSLHECSATVDLMEMNPFSGRAYFYKSGAAPTYVYRSGSLLKLRSHTLPVGIIRDPDTRRIEFELQEEDLVVMVSDGVTQGKEECPWLFDLLRSQGSEDVERLADRIAHYARSEGSSDDISVLVMRIATQ